MAIIQVTNIFIANTRAKAAEVNQNFQDVVDILAAHHHDPNIYTNAKPITNSGIASNANILDTQLYSPMTRSGLVNPSALQVVTVPKGGTGLAGLSVGDLIVANSTNSFKRLRLGTARQTLAVNVAGDDIEWINSTDKSQGAFTASGAISENDTVYVSAADTVKKIYPSAQGSGSSVSTAPSHLSSPKCMPLSEGGKYLHISGGNATTSAVLYAQVRTINATETDFSNGSEQTIYSTGGGVNGYDVCQIGTDKFLLIYQEAGSAGISVVVISVSGTTITVGSAVTIETTGDSGYQPACCKLNTDKALIAYVQDSNGDIYVQVLTVSGTTITTNTPAVAKVTSNGNINIGLAQLGTDSALIVYGDSNSSLYAKTISVSSTTPTPNSEQTLIATTKNYWFNIRPISSTRVLMVYNDNDTVAEYASILSISGSTVTKGSNLTLNATRQDHAYYGMHVISNSYALVSHYENSTTVTVFFLDISGATPSIVSEQSLSSSASTPASSSICKVSPWTYMVTGTESNSDYIILLTPVSSVRIGIAESDIADTASGNILFRFFNHENFSGLTAGSVYYVDDNAQPTTQSSLTAPQYGISFDTTTMLLT